MKAIHPTLLKLGLAALTASPAFAIEPPDDNAPPPAVQPAEKPAEQPAKPAAEKPAADQPAAAAFLGVGTSSVPEALAAHLNLKPEEGVLVRSLDPNGPAAKAGLAEHDVITKIDGQAVGSHADLVREVQKHQPGKEIAVDYIHQGKPANKSVTLTPRPDGAAPMPAPNQIDDLMLQGMPEEQAKRIREMIERQLRAFEDDGGEDPAGPAIPADPFNQLRDAQKRMRDLQKQMQERMGDALKQGEGGLRIQGGATFRMVDPEGSVELNSKDGGKEATVRDKDGKKVWSGPWDTEQDKAAAPPEVRARLDRLNIDETFKGGGLRLRLGGPGFIEPAPDENNGGAEKKAEEKTGGKPAKDGSHPTPEAPPSGEIR